MAETIIYFYAYLYGDTTRSSITQLAQAMILFLVLCSNALLVAFDTEYRMKEMHVKATKLSELIKKCKSNQALISAWMSNHFYPNIYTPQSPCISLQCTYRDGKLVNLPVCLLVEGDVIRLAPGHPAPGSCRSLEIPKMGESSSNPETHQGSFKRNRSSLELNAGELFVPSADFAKEAFTTPRLRKAARPAKFLMTETPFIKCLRLALQRAHDRPPTLFEKERHVIFAKYFEPIVILITWVLVLCLSAFQYGYIDAIKNQLPNYPKSLSMLLLRPAMTVLPLLPITLPLFWLGLNAYGVVYLLNSRAQKWSGVSAVQGSPGSISAAQNINLRGKSSIKTRPSPSETTRLYSDSEPRESQINLIFPMNWKSASKAILSLLFSRDGNIWRSTNIVQVLGSVTALCCVDKKGILSWPNPTADKVFFLNSSDPPLIKERNAFDSHSEDETEPNPDDASSRSPTPQMQPSCNQLMTADTDESDDDSISQGQRRKSCKFCLKELFVCNI